MVNCRGSEWVSCLAGALPLSHPMVCTANTRAKQRVMFGCKATQGSGAQPSNGTLPHHDELQGNDGGLQCGLGSTRLAPGIPGMSTCWRRERRHGSHGFCTASLWPFCTSTVPVRSSPERFVWLARQANMAPRPRTAYQGLQRPNDE